MNKVSILEDGVCAMEKLKEQLLALERYKMELAESDAAEQRIEQELQKKDAEITEELSAMLAAREQEIITSYEEQILRQKKKKKKAEEDKLKKKNKKVSERVAIETASLQEENASLLEEVRKVFRENKVSLLYNNRFYYAMFSPQGMGDVLIDLFFLLIMFLVLPQAIVYLAAPKNVIIFELLLYGILLLLVGGIYYGVHQRTKAKKPETIEKGKELRCRVRKNNHKIAKIKRRIQKDKDESSYELESYDKEIQKLTKKIREIEQEKGVAIATLKNTTSNVLANEVKNRHEEEVLALREQYDVQKETNHHTEEQIRELNFLLTTNYQAYLGAEVMNVQAVEEIITIMKETDGSTVSEALKIYHTRKLLPAQNEESVS